MQCHRSYVIIGKINTYNQNTTKAFDILIAYVYFTIMKMSIHDRML